MAPINVAGGAVVDTRVRNNERVTFDDAAGVAFAGVVAEADGTGLAAGWAQADKKLQARTSPTDRMARAYDGSS